MSLRFASSQVLLTLIETGETVGSVVKKRRKKMRKHKKRKLLRRARHKRKR